jgi:hypothetical protein
MVRYLDWIAASGIAGDLANVLVVDGDVGAFIDTT